jgi:hypothetical protein
MWYRGVVSRREAREASRVPGCLLLARSSDPCMPAIAPLLGGSAEAGGVRVAFAIDPERSLAMPNFRTAAPAAAPRNVLSLFGQATGNCY